MELKPTMHMIGCDWLMGCDTKCVTDWLTDWVRNGSKCLSCFRDQKLKPGRCWYQQQQPFNNDKIHPEDILYLKKQITKLPLVDSIKILWGNLMEGECVDNDIFLASDWNCTRSLCLICLNNTHTIMRYVIWKTINLEKTQLNLHGPS